MKYLSVCSGIEAATIAWHPLGWTPVAFSEIEPFPSAVLAHHWPDVPNLGDMTKYEEWKELGSVDLLAGGTPCQSFSVAGLRKGIHDPRGGLMLTYLEIAQRHRPRWVVWENVPGVLSSGGGRDFGAFLGALGELGYGWAYRVLDAQWFGVAQRRKRVFVVGCLGSWRSAAKVLFESESVCRDNPPSREAEEVAPAGPAGRAGGGDQVAARMVAFGEYTVDGTASAMKARDYKDATDLVAGARTGNSTTDIRAGCGIAEANSPMFTLQAGKQHGVALAFPANLSGTQRAKTENLSPSLGAKNPTAIAVDTYNQSVNPHVSAPISSAASDIDHTRGAIVSARVRRLTPTECERLQGFPDGHTAVTWKGKPAPDAPRYKALGNSMAVPCMAWIGRRIERSRLASV